MLKFYKYSADDNCFVIIDGRRTDVSRFRRADVIHTLCCRYGTDALMILDDSLQADFRMEHYNSDGSHGAMGSGGGRCAVAFADLVGVKAFHSKEYVFEAADGLHHAEILSHLGECKIVRLEMSDSESITGPTLNLGDLVE